MESYLYYIIKKILDQPTRTRLKAFTFRLKKTFRMAYEFRYGIFTSADLRKEIQERVGGDFEILMVHCSFNDLSPMYSESALDLLNVLLEICGPNRTLAMPAFFWGKHGINVSSHYRETPIFDTRKTPSQMGLLSEVFRRSPGVRRSLHPTHSICAFGPLAEQLTSTHHLCPTTFGERTPFGVMASSKTIILGIGTKYYRVLTQVHAAEDLMGDKFPIRRNAEIIPVKLIDGKNEYSYNLKVYLDKFSKRLDVIRPLLNEHDLCEWKFHGVPLFYTFAGKVTEALCHAALHGKTIYA